MLFHAHALTSLWFDAFATIVFVINRLPSVVLHDKSPFDLLFGSFSNYANFMPFGCHVYAFLRDYVSFLDGKVVQPLPLPAVISPMPRVRPY